MNAEAWYGRVALRETDFHNAACQLVLRSSKVNCVRDDTT